MKKKSENNKSLVPEEPNLSVEDWEEFERGVNYFNNAQFQHSYEAWELLSERKSSNEKKFLKGVMDLAIACQSLIKDNNVRTALSNFEKAHEKLHNFPLEFYGVPIEPLIRLIEEYKQLSSNGNRNKHGNLLPKMHFHKPANPDILVELSEIVQSNLFAEGIKLFNQRLYWEAHEVWEDLLREQVGNGKIFVDAFTKMAEAFHFVQRGKISSAIYLFEKVLNTLCEYERMNCKLSLSNLLKDIQTTLDLLRSSMVIDYPQTKLSKAPLITYLPK